MPRTPRPVVVLMSGPPGAGKSTLASMLGERLRLPVIDKDRLRQGIRWTLGVDDLEGVPAGPPVFYSAIEAFLALGISVIGDMTLFRGLSEPDIERRLAPVADLMNVHCYTDLAAERFEARSIATGLTPSHSDDLLPLVRELQADLRRPLELGCPVITVDTTDGFAPSVDDIAAFIIETRADLTVD